LLARTRTGDTGASPENSPAWAVRSAPPRSGRSSTAPVSIRPHDAWALPGRSSCVAKLTEFSRATFLLRHRAPHQAVLLRGRGTPQPPDTHPWRHRTSHRRLGLPTRTQSDHGPRRSCCAGHIRDPRSGLPVHQHVRRDLRQRRHPDHQDSDPSTSCKRDHGTLDLRRELLDRMLILNARHLRRVLAEYEHHFTTHRPHRSLSQAAPLRALPPLDTTNTKIIRRDRLGGAIHEYMQVA
jgi:hypothetical protein